MALRYLMRGVYGAEQWLAICYLTAAIFPVYILHQTILVVVAHALKPSNLFPPLEGVLLVLVTAATCFLSYEAIRRWTRFP
jgi:glucans biosynthesis protein C